ncbi:TauD/TfdA dioxygenase family protein [Methylomonas sp. MED-D]|uniref:Taurine catabolism dioxygenase n=1 Tax=Methylomonas koyamae TaxID=702114 RepID=A0A177P9H8_9GAMM|nr:TauD/TfdA family dioxygenase [Methylomonas koyamae]NJA07150.1 TauD/TfdA family dioxygenase [Methylococcaceae bacterium WWC4]OAI26988.1 taurine catabolism dioxygenase [Methylomonas koyamae]
MITKSKGLEINEAKQGKIGAEIIGLDVNSLSENAPELALIRQLIYKNKLVVLRGQELNAERYVAFTRKLGRPQVYFQPQYHHPDHPEVFVSSNVIEADGKKLGVSGTGRYWHTDCAFEKHPLSFTSIYPLVFPKSARETSYIDMAAVYSKLPDELRSYVETATAVHEGKMRYKVQASDIDKSLAELLDRIHNEVPPVNHPAVIQHPVTGEKILYISSGFTTKLAGLSYEENERVMQALFDFAEKPEHIHTHYWEEGDLIIWDNRPLVHKASSIQPGEKSKSYRIGIYDDLPFYVGIN